MQTLGTFYPDLSQSQMIIALTFSPSSILIQRLVYAERDP
jgi:hypothetical protein